MGGDALGIAAILTGLAAIVVAAGGILLAIRAVRSKERKAAAQEIEQLTQLLDAERNARIATETRAHAMAVTLASHGLPVPPLTVHDVPAIEGPRLDPGEFRREGN